MKFRKPNSPSNKWIAARTRQYISNGWEARKARSMAREALRSIDGCRKTEARRRRAAETAEFLAGEGHVKPGAYWKAAEANGFDLLAAVDYGASAARSYIGKTVDEFANAQIGARFWADAPDASRQWLLDHMFATSAYGVENGRIANTARHWHESA